MIVEDSFEDLAKKYPSLLLRSPLTGGRTDYPVCMQFPGGWLGIITDLVENISDLGLPDEFFFTQIKEKFGQLRVYTTLTSDTVEKLISEAVRKSSVTCEFCGDAGQTREDRGWMVTLCDKHNIDEGAE